MRRALLGVLVVAMAATLSAAPVQALPRAKWQFSSNVGFTAALALSDGRGALIQASRSAPGKPQVCVHLLDRVDGETQFSYCERAQYVISPHPPWRAHVVATLRTYESADIVVDGWWQGTGVEQPRPYFGMTYSLLSPVIVGAVLAKRAGVWGSLVVDGRQYELRGHPGFMQMHTPP